MDIIELIAHRDELREQARAIRVGSRDLPDEQRAESAAEHRALMGRISQLNEAIRNR